MTNISILATEGDTAGMEHFLENQSVSNNDLSWAMMRCIEHRHHKTLNVLLAHTKTLKYPSADLFAGPLAWAAAEDIDVFKLVLQYTPSHKDALRSALTNLMEQEKQPTAQVLENFQLWCAHANLTALEEAFESVVVWELPRFVEVVCSQWTATAGAARPSLFASVMLKNLGNCFDGHELQSSTFIRFPQIYALLLEKITLDMAKNMLDNITQSRSNTFLNWDTAAYDTIEPVLHSLIQKQTLSGFVKADELQISKSRKM